MAPRKPITLDANGAFSELSASDILEITPSASFSTPAIVPDGVTDSGVVVSDTAVGLLLGGTLVFSGLEFGASQFLTFLGTSAVFSFTNVISMSAGSGAARMDLGPSEVQLQHGNGSQVTISPNTSGESRVEFNSSGAGSVAIESPVLAAGITFTLMAKDGLQGNPIITDGSGALSFEAKGGTTFPLIGLYDGRVFWRTDLQREFRYDGTDWLGTMFPLAFGRNGNTNVPGFQRINPAGNVTLSGNGGYPIPQDLKLLRVQTYSDNAGDPISGSLTVRVADVVKYTRVLTTENSVDEDELGVDLDSSSTGGLRVAFNLTGGTLSDMTIIIWVCERR